MAQKLTFSTSTEMVAVEAAALVYVEADGNYSTLHTIQGASFTLTMQLGQVERHIAATLAQTAVTAPDAVTAPEPVSFIRIGKSLIVNRRYICYINHPRQRLSLSDGRSFKHDLSASRDALKALKDFLEKEITS